MGKIPGKILQRGQANDIPVIAIAGGVKDEEILLEAGFKGVYATKPEDMTLEEAMKREVAMENIRSTVKQLLEKE